MAQPNSPFDKNPFSDPRVNPYAAAGVNSPYSKPVKPSNGLAIAGLVVAIVGSVMFFVPVLGPLVAFTGVVLAGFGWRSAVKKLGGSGKGMAISALCIGLLGTAIGGTASTGMISYTAYMMESGVEFRQLREEISKFQDEKGRLPVSLDELYNPDLTRDMFGNPYVYSPNGEGNFTLRGQAFGAGLEFLRNMQLVYSSENDTVSVPTGQVIWDTRQLDQITEALGESTSANTKKPAAAKAAKPTADEECPTCPSESKEAPAATAGPDA
jgi:hypothetical protein